MITVMVAMDEENVERVLTPRLRARLDMKAYVVEPVTGDSFLDDPAVADTLRIVDVMLTGWGCPRITASGDRTLGRRAAPRQAPRRRGADQHRTRHDHRQRRAGAGVRVGTDRRRTGGDPEPLPADSPLLSLPNVFVTPHLAGALGNEIERLGEVAVGEIERYAAGQPLEHAIRPEELHRIA